MDTCRRTPHFDSGRFINEMRTSDDDRPLTVDETRKLLAAASNISSAITRFC
jgi:hypothetical protein